MDMTAPAPYSQAVPGPEANEMASRLANLQVNSNTNGGTMVTQPCDTNGRGLPTVQLTNSRPTVVPNSRARTGIPRYGIPYRRPPQRSMFEAENPPTTPTSNGHQEEVFDENLVSPVSAASAPTHQQRPSGNGLSAEHPPLSSDGRNSMRSASSRARYDRAASEDPFRCESGSEHSSAFSASGQPRRITSKVGSMINARYKPGGGNVKIFDEKIHLNVKQGKCNSKANIHHKPGGGDIEILDSKLTFKETSKSKIGSFQNAKHVAGGGDVKIDNKKLEFNENARSKVASLKNTRHHPGGGDVQIYNEKLPWLKYNKPNLPEEERVRINKQKTASPHLNTSSQSSNLS